MVDVARAEFAAKVIGALSTRPEILKQVSQLDVANLHDAVVILDDDAALLHVGESDFAARLQQYIDLAPALRERVAAIDYVDLRFDDRLYVRPAKTAGRRSGAGTRVAARRGAALAPTRGATRGPRAGSPRRPGWPHSHTWRRARWNPPVWSGTTRARVRRAPSARAANRSRRRR